MQLYIDIDLQEESVKLEDGKRQGRIGNKFVQVGKAKNVEEEKRKSKSLKKKYGQEQSTTIRNENKLF